MEAKDFFNEQEFLTSSKLPKERRIYTYFDLIAFANIYHISEVEKLNLPVVINWVADKDETPPKNKPYYCYGYNKEPRICYYAKKCWWDEPYGKQRLGITHWAGIKPPCL